MGLACADLAEDHADGDAHASDAGFSAHGAGVLGDAIEGLHDGLLAVILL